MDLVKIFFDYEGTLIINNQVSQKGPFSLDWPRDAQFIVDTLKEKFTMNISEPNQNKLECIEITPNHFVIMFPQPQTINLAIPVVHTSSHYVNMKKYTVELGNTDEQTFFTIFSKQNDKVAFPLGIKVASPTITIQDNLIVLKDENVHFGYDPQNQIISFHKKYWNSLTPIQFRFLQLIQNKDFEQAASLLTFTTGPQALERYFGDFDIILNNYLDEQTIISVVQKTTSLYKKARNHKFSMDGGLIGNIQ